MATDTTQAASNEGLKRLGGGRWQTRDGRFTIEPQSGTWAVVDAEQTDELGLPLVRGPFGSLTAAKAAIGGARTSAAPESPLAARTRSMPKTKASPATAKRDTVPKAAAPTPPPEPAWLAELDPDDRRRARRLVDALTEVDAPDPEGIARRDVAGGVAAAAAFAAARAIRALGPEASPAAIARLLVEGHDDALGVRWRLVDGDGRPIVVDLKG